MPKLVRIGTAKAAKQQLRTVQLHVLQVIRLSS